MESDAGWSPREECAKMEKRSLFLVCVTLLLSMGLLQNTMSLDIHDAVNMGAPDEADYMLFLQKFPRYAERQWHSDYKGNPQIGYFGSGRHDQNEMRSLSNFIFVYALLAVDEGYDESVSGIGQDTLLKHAKAALRYFTRTHVTGDMLCADSHAWGKQPAEWLSPWIISKAVAGARLIWDELTQTEKGNIRRVLIYEADYQLRNSADSQEYEDTNAELSAWNGEVVAWASSLYPTHSHAEEWHSKAQEFFMNTFSVRGDRNDTRVVDGKPVSEWVYTTNAHPDFTLEGHGAYSFDYIACPLHSIAWSYYAFMSNGQSVPESLFHHVRDVWETLKKTHLYSGRFACFQGKDWARHVYGSSFIMPALVLFENEFGDADARLIEQLRFRSFQYEQERSINGSIFGRRFAYLTSGWPAIYETDCYANMGLAYLLHKFAPLAQAEDMETFQRKVEGSFHSEYCDFLYTRSQDLFASFSWQHYSGPYPMALFAPGDDHMVEWEAGNLIGHIDASGFDMSLASMSHNETIFEGSSDANSSAQLMGFTTTGHIREGERGKTYGIDHYVSFTALPKYKLAIMIEYLLAGESIFITEQDGLSYYLPNDVFNNRERQIYWENDELRLWGFGGRGAVAIDSDWINVDNKLGMISLLDNGHFRIEPARGRDIWTGQICEQICYSATQNHLYKTGDVIREQCYVLISGDSDFTRDIAESGVQWLETDHEFIKAAAFMVGEFSGLIIANFHWEPMDITAQFRNGKQVEERIPALETMVLRYPVTEEILSVQSGTIVQQHTAVQLHDDAKPTTWGRAKSLKLFQNYPNPFNPETWFPFQLAEDSNISISIHDAKGNLVRTLQLGQRKAGSYLSRKKAAHWDGRDENGEIVASGVYFYRIKAGDSVAESRKMVIVQ